MLERFAAREMRKPGYVSQVILEWGSNNSRLSAGKDARYLNKLRRLLSKTEEEDRKLILYGSAQEFVETRISGRFLKNDEFCFCDRHALCLKQ